MTRNQLEVFLDATLRVAPGHNPLFPLLARTGGRIGKAIALQWPDINLVDREIRVERGFSARQIGTPKTGHGRTVDMSQQLARVLRRLQFDRKPETLRRGWPEVPAWVFCNAAGKPLDPSRIRRTFRRVLRAAGLPGETDRARLLRLRLSLTGNCPSGAGHVRRATTARAGLSKGSA
jgi:integrase